MAEFVPEPAELSGEWRADLRLFAHYARRSMLRHPWLAARPMGWTFGPNSMRLAEAALGTVDGLGLSIDQMLSVTGMITSYVMGVVSSELADAEARRRTGLTAEQLMRANGSYLHKVLATGRYPLVERVIVEARQPHMGADERFEYGLESILDGIAGSLP
jgi:hypothetical protein